MPADRIPLSIVERHRAALAEHWTAPVECSHRGLGWGCTCGASGFSAEVTTLQAVAQAGAEHISTAALAAALEGCEVREERRVIGEAYGSHQQQEWLTAGDWGLVEHVAKGWRAAPSFNGVKVQRHWVITTPATPKEPA